MTERQQRRRARRSKLAKPEIQRQLEGIEFATVSSVRALQMDLDGDEGVPSSWC